MRKRRPGELLEAQFQRQVVDLAAILGFHWFHVRAGRTVHGWAVPIEGTFGEGWPDLFLARERDSRSLFAELKREGEQLDPEQERVAAILRAAGHEVHVWHPSDMDSGLIPEVLR